MRNREGDVGGDLHETEAGGEGRGGWPEMEGAWQGTEEDGGGDAGDLAGDGLVEESGRGRLWRRWGGGDGSTAVWRRRQPEAAAAAA